jgi:hypothetical protein
VLRASGAVALGDLPLHVLIEQGLLAPRTGPAGERVRATPAERAHVERLRADPESWGRP